MRRLSFLALVTLPAAAAFLLGGCAATYKNTLEFNPVEPLRVAVLPFYEAGKDGKPVVRDASLAIDKVALLSKSLEESPSTLVQNAVQSELAKTRLDIVSPGLVGAQLAHHGFTHAKQYDYPKILAASPKDLCELLYCDALLYGVVSDWDRSYYGVQTVNSVSIQLRLVRVADGKVLFTSSGDDTESRGLSGIPTGFSSVVLEPIKGLDSEIIADLAGRMVATMIEPLRVEKRPDFLNSSPPAIFASSHDGAGRKVSPRSPLTVLMLGSSGKAAYFSVGEKISQVAMFERDQGHYVGEFYPLAGEDLAQQEVYVHLVDDFGRQSRQRVGVGPVSVR